MRRESQTSAILKHLKEKGSITSMEAFNLYGCTRLSAKIFDLRKDGYIINSEKETVLNRYGNTCVYARYVLLGQPTVGKLFNES